MSNQSARRAYERLHNLSLILHDESIPSETSCSRTPGDAQAKSSVLSIFFFCKKTRLNVYLALKIIANPMKYITENDLLEQNEK